MKDYNKLLEKAKSLATLAHKDQKRWGGEPYIIHPEAVANSVSNIKSKIVAWLHDTVEDTDATLDLLLGNGFPKEIVDAVDSVSKRNDETYLDFILRAKENRIGRTIKIADINHNLSCSGKMSKSMRDKYLLAKYILLTFEE